MPPPTTPRVADPDGTPVEYDTPTAPTTRPATPLIVEDGTPRAAEYEVEESRRRYRFDSVIVGLIGLALTVIGAIVVIRAGIDRPLDEPVVSIFGFNHTAILGMIEAGFGICLLLCAAAGTRVGAVFFGVLLGAAAIVGAVGYDRYEESLGLERNWAWWMLGAAAVVVLVSLFAPRGSRRTTRVERVDTTV